MLRTASSLPHTGLLTLGFDPAHFPGRAVSLLPGLLGSYPDRTSIGRRRQAYEHKDPSRHYVTMSPPALLAAQMIKVKEEVSTPQGETHSQPRERALT
jgi:hypothetical protein